MADGLQFFLEQIRLGKIDEVEKVAFQNNSEASLAIGLYHESKHTINERLEAIDWFYHAARLGSSEGIKKLSEYAERGYRKAITLGQELNLRVKTESEKKTETKSEQKQSKNKNDPYPNKKKKKRLESQSRIISGNVLFLDYGRNLNSGATHDPVFGTSLTDQYNASVQVDHNIPPIDFFRHYTLGSSRTVGFSSPSFNKNWEKDEKKNNSEPTSFFKNIAIRFPFDNVNDLVLIGDLVVSSNTSIANKITVKGFVFISRNTVHYGEIRRTCSVVAKFDSEVKSDYYDKTGLPVSVSNASVFDASLISQLENTYVVYGSEFKTYLEIWKEYLRSRIYILELEESRSIGVSANLVSATYAEVGDSVVDTSELIPYLIQNESANHFWLKGKVRGEGLKPAILLHISKDYGSEEYADVINRRPMGWRQEFDQFTKFGIKLCSVTDEEPIIRTFDTKLGRSYIEKIRPEERIDEIERLSKDRVVSLQEKKLAGIDNEVKAVINALESELVQKAGGDKEKLENISILLKKKELQIRGPITLKHESAYESAIEEELNDKKKKISECIDKQSSIRLHIYFDITDDLNSPDDYVTLSELSNKMERSNLIIHRNMDGDRKVLERQKNGLNNLMDGYVMNPFLATELFCPEVADSTPNNRKPLDYYHNLNDSQKNAVEKALYSDGMFLIQGPPGTGKTQTIAELAIQFSRLGKKVLIASQNNKAIENALSRLPHTSDIRPLSILRIQSELYPYEQLTSNFYDGIKESLQKKIDRYSNERKYVENHQLILKRLSNLKQKVDSNEEELLLIKEKMESLEDESSSLNQNLVDIRNEIIKQEEDIETLNRDASSIVNGSYSGYSDLLEGLPKSLESIPNENLDQFLGTLIKIDEDRLQSSIISLEEFAVNEDDESYETFKSTMGLIRSNNDDLIAIYSDCTELIEKMKSISKKKLNMASFQDKVLLQKKLKEKDILNRLSLLNHRIKDLKENSGYLELERTKDEFIKDIHKCLRDLNVPLNGYESDSIELLEKQIKKLQDKFTSVRDNESLKMDAFNRIVDYLSDKSIESRDKSRLNPVLLNYVNVIGLTCSRADNSLRLDANSNDYIRLNKLNIDIVILDETSKIPFVEILPPALYGKTLIMVGDHRQLPPMYSRVDKEDFVTYDPNFVNQRSELLFEKIYNESFFGMLFEKAPDACKTSLNIQYRMHPQIMEIVNTFYPDSPLTFGGSIMEKEHRITIDGRYRQILSPEQHVLFIHCPGRDRRESGSQSYYNNSEVEAVLRILDLLDQNCKYDADGNDIEISKPSNRLSVGVICAYRGQVNRIRDYKRSYRSFNSEDEKFQISTVDNFQGDERDIIVLSMVRTTPCDWLSDYRRINVAMSRARRLLIIVGNSYALSNIDVSMEEGDSGSKLYEEIIDKIAETGGYLVKNDIMGDE